MLGSFYEKAWDFERQAQAQRHIDPPIISADQPFKKRRKSASNEMHLPKTETLQLGSSRAASIPPLKEKTGDGVESVARKEDSTETNEVSVRMNPEQDRESIVEALIASWMILIYRYQQDTFQRFSWGTDTGEDPCLQCVPVSQTDVSKITTLSDLNVVVRKVVPEDAIARGCSETVFIFNDGAPDEVRHLHIDQGP
jgi:hypothetical protein